MATADGGSSCVDSDVDVPEYEDMAKEQSIRKQPSSTVHYAPRALKTWYCDEEVSKEEDELEKIFDKVEKLLEMKEFEKDLRKKVFEIYPNFTTVLHQRLLDLKRRDCGLVIAGDTSCGKSTLVNLMLGEKVSPTDLFQNTSKIIKLRGSDKMEIQVFDESCQMLAKHTSLKSVKQLRKLIKNMSTECYSDDSSDSEDDDKHSDYEISDENWDAKKADLGTEIDIFFPSPLLKGNIMIVDTPGCGNFIHGNFKTKLFEYLPNAISFIFVLDVSRGGGLEMDRIVEIFKYLQNEEDMHSFEARDVIFVLNKIDSISPQKKKFIERCTSKIKENIRTVWPYVQMDHVFCMSTAKIKDGDEEYLKEYKVFEKVLQKIIQKNENKRVKTHLSYLAELVKTIKLIIEPRFIQSETTVDEKRLFVQTETRKLDDLVQLCNQKQKIYVSKIYSHISDLSQKIFEDMQTEEFMQRILSEGGEELMNSSRLQVRTRIAEIVEKLTKEIVAREVRNINDSELNNSLLKDFEEIYELTYGLQRKVSGLDDTKILKKKLPLVLQYAISTIGFTIGLLYAAQREIHALPRVIPAINEFIYSKAYSLATTAISFNIPIDRFVQSNIEDVIVGFDVKTVREMLDATIGDQLRTLSRKIFKEILPAEIEKKKISIKGLENEHNVLLEMHAGLKELKKKLMEIEDHTNDCYSLIYKD